MYGGIIWTFAEFENLVARVQNFSPKTKLIAILFMRKGQEITDQLIAPSLDYFDRRSGDALHFVMPGWFYQEAGRGTDPQSVEYGWFFDNELFVQACAVIASETSWNYSGGTDLLLTTTRSSRDEAILDFSGVINIPLHEIVGKKLVTSPEVLITRFIQFAENYDGIEPLLHLSWQEARVSFFEGVSDAILSQIFRDAKDRVEYRKHFLIKDVSKEKRTGRAVAQVRAHPVDPDAKARNPIVKA